MSDSLLPNITYKILNYFENFLNKCGGCLHQDKSNYVPTIYIFVLLRAMNYYLFLWYYVRIHFYLYASIYENRLDGMETLCGNDFNVEWGFIIL